MDNPRNDQKEIQRLQKLVARQEAEIARLRRELQKFGYTWEKIKT